MKRDFTLYGKKFHLNDNPGKNEFSGKYKLLWYNDIYKTGAYWEEIYTVNSKKEALEILHNLHDNKTKCFSTWYD